MIPIFFYIVMAVLAGYYLRRYKITGDVKHLKSSGTVIITATFFAAFGRGVEGVLFSDKAWLAYAVLLGGSLAGALLMAAGYAGWRKVYALAQAGVFVVITALLISSLGYFRTVILAARAQQACSEVVPGSDMKRVYGLSEAQREEMAPKLAAALASGDRFVRLGALYALASMPKACAGALPAVIKLLEAGDEDELNAAAGLLEKMGPDAAAALPALEARLAGAEGGARGRVEAALKAIRPVK